MDAIKAFLLAPRTSPSSTTTLGLSAANTQASDTLAIRYLAMADTFRQARGEWMKSTFSHFEEMRFAEGDTSFLSLANSNYNVLLIGGNDVRRMSKLVRQNRSILANRVTIALTSGMNAQRRAQLLMAGFDDVMNIDRMDPTEAIARIQAMWRRYAAHLERDIQVVCHLRRLRELCDADRLTVREKAIMDLLLRAPNRFASYGAIIREISSFTQEVTHENLKVIISTLRKKLHPDTAIVARMHRGYELVVKSENPSALPDYEVTAARSDLGRAG